MNQMFPLRLRGLPVTDGCGVITVTSVRPPTADAPMTTERFRIESQGDVMVFSFLQKHLSAEEELKQVFAELKQQLDDLDVVKVVLDFKAVTFVASSLLGQLVALKKFVAERHGWLRLATAGDDVMETFRITRLDEYFEIYDDIGGAIESLAGTPRPSRG